MKLINVTNSHSRLVLSQLENTDAQVVQVYSAGSTTVIHTQAPTHHEIVLTNKRRNIKETELQEIKQRLMKKINDKTYNEKDISILKGPGLVEISIPLLPVHELQESAH
jgi:hypothetical protein